MSVADGRLSFFARSCRGDTGCAARLMPAGHLLFCATKKVSKKVAGNAIPRSRLPSNREIAHSRVGCLYLHFDANVRNREYFLNLRFIFSSSFPVPFGPYRVPICVSDGNSGPFGDNADRFGVKSDDFTAKFVPKVVFPLGF